MAHDSLNLWKTILPAVFLGIRSAVKEVLGSLAAKIVYGTTLRLPGEFTDNYTVDSQPCRASGYFPHTTHHKKTISNSKNSKHVHMYFCDVSQLHHHSLRWTLQGHIKEWSTVQNPAERQC